MADERFGEERWGGRFPNLQCFYDAETAMFSPIIQKWKRSMHGWSVIFFWQ